MTPAPHNPPRDRRAHLTTRGKEWNRAVAVTPHFLASEAALEAMAAGGSAADGAIAANAVLGVVLPDTCGIGGDLFALVHRQGDSEPTALNASGRAGSGVNAQELRDRGLTSIPALSPLAITVPGCVDGWAELHSRYGRIPLRSILEPAIELARGGFPVAAELASSLQDVQMLIQSQDSAASWYPGGEAPAPGTVIKRPDLAATLLDIADDGRRAFYEGPVATGIIDASEGALMASDLLRKHAEWVEPLGLEVMGAKGWTIPPNSQGYLTLAGAWLFEQLDPPRDPADPAFTHLAIESYRAVAWERDELVADPDHLPIPPADLVDSARLAPRLDRLSRDAVAAWPGPGPAGGGTAFLCTTDPTGLSTSLIQSNYHNIGCGRSAGGSGVFLHNRGADFDLRPGHPNEYASGKRPLHTLSPTIWTVGTEPKLLLGTRGGQYQPQLLVQLAATMLWAGVPADQAQSHPRWLVDGWLAGSTPEVRIENRFPQEAHDQLATLGHRVSKVEAWQEGWGPVAAIASDEDGVTAAADPRSSSAAALG